MAFLYELPYQSLTEAYQFLHAFAPDRTELYMLPEVENGSSGYLCFRSSRRLPKLKHLSDLMEVTISHVINHYLAPDPLYFPTWSPFTIPGSTGDGFFVAERPSPVFSSVLCAAGSYPDHSYPFYGTVRARKVDLLRTYVTEWHTPVYPTPYSTEPCLRLPRGAIVYQVLFVNDRSCICIDEEASIHCLGWIRVQSVQDRPCRRPVRDDALVYDKVVASTTHGIRRTARYRSKRDRIENVLSRVVHGHLQQKPRDMAEVLRPDLLFGRYLQRMTFPYQYEYRRENGTTFLDSGIRYTPFSLTMSATAATVDRLVRTQMEMEMTWDVSQVVREECGPGKKTTHRRYHYRCAPPVLLIHVTRLSGTGVDTSLRIEPSPVIKLPIADVPCVLENPATYVSYYLKGIGIRSGTDSARGHWVAMVHTDETQWTLIDDQDDSIYTHLPLTATIQGTVFLYDRIPPDQPHASCVRIGPSYTNPNTRCYINALLQLFAHSTAIARLMGIQDGHPLQVADLRALFHAGLSRKKS
jgi:hypothetical protein